MIKIAYCSDLHLEFADRDFDLPDADILILAGDILVAADLDLRLQENKIGQVYRKFLQDVSDKYPRVYYTGGNHEHYHGDINTTENMIRTTLKNLDIKNIFYADSSVCIDKRFSCTIDDSGKFCIDRDRDDNIKIVFSTLWTDAKKRDPNVMYSGIRHMKDYAKIQNESNPLRVADTCDLHDKHREHIKNGVVGHDKVVVFSHHAPNMNSAMYLDTVSYMYCCTDMDDIIMDNPQIKVWIHGHTHQANDYMIGETRILSNPRGYKGHEPLANEFQIKVIEL